MKQTGLNVRNSLYKGAIWIILVIVGLIFPPSKALSGNDYLQERISINIQNKTIAEAFSVIEKETNYLFFYYDEITDLSKKINLNANNQTIEQIIDYILKETNYTYIIDGRQVFIMKKETFNEVKNNLQTLKQKPIKIEGVVVDENGDPLPGVTITLDAQKGIGTFSDAYGKFKIIDTDPNKTIKFSFIGYETLEVPLKDSKHIKMVQNENVLKDVVITGIFNRGVSSYSGNIATYTKGEIEKVGNQNIIQSLKNLDPSLNVFQNMTMGSDPNTMPELQLRGASSFPMEAGEGFRSKFAQDPNAPLFMLDGIETSLESIIDMDMNRVESVSILKDASAKAIYGSKAANGVIVIETKKLTGAGTRISYSAQLDLEVPDLSSYNLTNALEKLELERLWGRYAPASSETGYDMYKKEQLYSKRLGWALSGINTNWLAKPLRTGVGQKHNVSIELGEKVLRGIANFTYNDEQGAMKGSSRKTLTGDMSLTYRVHSLLFRNTMRFTNMKNENSPYGSFQNYANQNPYHDPYNPDGTIKRYLEYKEPASVNQFEKTYVNPLYDAALNPVDKESYDDFFNNFYVEGHFFNGFKITGRVGLGSYRYDREEFYPADHSKFESYRNDESMKLKLGSYDRTYGKRTTFTGRLTVQYSKMIGKHDLFFNVAGELNDSKYEEQLYKTEGFPGGRLVDISYARQYVENSVPITSNSKSRSASFQGFFSYSYDDIYMADLTASRDGASVFGTNNPWTTTWSAAGSVNLHKILPVEGLDLLKLRTSYGSTGNQKVVSNASVSTYYYDVSMNYLGNIAAVLRNLANPNLAWSTKNTLEVGTRFKYKSIDGYFTYYDELTKNDIQLVGVTPSTGFGNAYENVGEIGNRGIEANLSWTIFNNKDYFIKIGGGIKTNNQKIRKLSASMQAYNDRQMALSQRGDNPMPVLEFRDGYPTRAIWVVQSLGIDPVTGNEIFLSKNGEKTTTWKAEDKVFAGTLNDKYNGNVRLDMEYKGIGISAVGTFLGGGQMYNSTLLNKVENINIDYNLDKRVYTDRWRNPGDISKYTSIVGTWTNPDNGQTEPRKTQATTRFVQDKDEFTLSALNIYYVFNQDWLAKKTNNTIKYLRAGFYISDLFTLSTIKIERGTSYPFARTFSFSLSASF